MRILRNISREGITVDIPVMETRVSNLNAKIGFRNNILGIFLKSYMQMSP